MAGILRFTTSGGQRAMLNFTVLRPLLRPFLVEVRYAPEEDERPIRIMVKNDRRWVELYKVEGGDPDLADNFARSLTLRKDPDNPTVWSRQLPEISVCSKDSMFNLIVGAQLKRWGIFEACTFNCGDTSSNKETTICVGSQFYNLTNHDWTELPDQLWKILEDYQALFVLPA